MFVAFCRRCGVSWLAGQLQFLAKNPATRLLIGHSSNILQTHSFIGCYTADGQALPVLRIFKDFYGQKWWHAEVRVGCMSLSLVKAAPAKGTSLSLSLSQPPLSVHKRGWTGRACLAMTSHNLPITWPLLPAVCGAARRAPFLTLFFFTAATSHECVTVRESERARTPLFKLLSIPRYVVARSLA